MRPHELKTALKLFLIRTWWSRRIELPSPEPQSGALPLSYDHHVPSGGIEPPFQV